MAHSKDKPLDICQTAPHTLENMFFTDKRNYIIAYIKETNLERTNLSELYKPHSVMYHYWWQTCIITGDKHISKPETNAYHYRRQLHITYHYLRQTLTRLVRNFLRRLDFNLNTLV